ncbi:hypothetical protein [Sphingomonas sp. GB1N7]|uniref:hypothetical protein n=1 Tax=Parasphingomonas caseinilytica TaxID=3096158 RepID=UPI002FCA9A50
MTYPPVLYAISGRLRVANILDDNEAAVLRHTAIERQARHIEVCDLVVGQSLGDVGFERTSVAQPLRYDFKLLAMIARRAEITRSPYSTAKDRWTTLAQLSFAMADACRSACSRFLL